MYNVVMHECGESVHAMTTEELQKLNRFVKDERVNNALVESKDCLLNDALPDCATPRNSYVTLVGHRGVEPRRSPYQGGHFNRNVVALSIVTHEC